MARVSAKNINIYMDQVWQIKNSFFTMYVTFKLFWSCISQIGQEAKSSCVQLGDPTTFKSSRALNVRRKQF